MRLGIPDAWSTTMDFDEELTYPGLHERLTDPVERQHWTARFHAVRAGFGTERAFSLTASRAVASNGLPEFRFGVEAVLAALAADEHRDA
ncbi:hypothetical protein R8Z50_12050 [Longispora sp. K20-0274]|uniref:hypothetical protein n=1 Tax=Longispora sp. K20-0274 TaxID=3088255 RepID=UPI00399C3613